MAESFDPYHKWLGIPPKDQPPHHYRLLGLDLFETDPEVIEAAANRQMAYIQGCATGPYVSLSQKVLNEVAQARLALLDPKRKPAYDEQLRTRLGPVQIDESEFDDDLGSPVLIQPLTTLQPPSSFPPQAIQPQLIPSLPSMQQMATGMGGPAAATLPQGMPAEPGFDINTRRGRSAAVGKTARGKSNVRFDWRFGAFILGAVALVIIGIVIAHHVRETLEGPQELVPAQTAPAKR
ncbi:MAG: hypothetical protein K8T25_17200 [Planctomycetia bacterium]|nr:hypothetical protein [Planctomycetia bacterium]